MYARALSPYRNCAIATLMIFVLPLLAGCAPAPPELPPPTQAPPTIPSAVPSPAPTIQPPTPTSAPTPTQFTPKATIKLFVHVPLSGGLAETGTDLQRAAEMAVEDLSGPLNALGYAVVLVPYDDKMDIKTAEANASQIVADPAFLCGVGNYTSGITIQTSEIYHQARLAFVTPSSTNAAVADRGYLEVNRVIGRLDIQGMAAAKFAKSQGFSSVYLIQNGADAFKKNGEYFKRQADQLGIKVVGILTTDVTDDFSSIVSRMMNLNPDLVYFAGLAAQAGPFFRQARAAGFKGAFLVIESDPALGDLAGPLFMQDGGAYYIDPAAPLSAYPGGAQFEKEFQGLYGTEPLPYSAQAYDAAGICLKAIEEASKAGNGEVPTRAEVAKTIRALVDYPGITGTYTFDNKGDPTVLKYFVYKVVNPSSADWTQNQLIDTIEVSTAE